MSELCASGWYPTGPQDAKECRDLDGRALTLNFELRVITVCDEVSLRLWFLPFSQNDNNSCHLFLLIQRAC